MNTPPPAGPAPTTPPPPTLPNGHISTNQHTHNTRTHKRVPLSGYDVFIYEVCDRLNNCDTAEAVVVVRAVS